MTRWLILLAVLVVGMVGVSLAVKQLRSETAMTQTRKVETPTVSIAKLQPAPSEGCEKILPVASRSPIEQPACVAAVPVVAPIWDEPKAARPNTSFASTTSSLLTDPSLTVLPNGTQPVATLPLVAMPPVAGTILTPSVPEAPVPNRVIVRSPVVDQRLQVMLQMGDGDPRLEIRDGDEVMLKVQSEAVEVRTDGLESGADKAATDRNVSPLVLKASRRVKFLTPGGEGSCDELQIMTATGVVTLSGNVTLKYARPKGETTFHSEKLTFRFRTSGPIVAKPASLGSVSRETVLTETPTGWIVDH